MRDSYIFYTDKLQGEYRETFDRVNMYVGTQGIDDDTREEHMGQLLDMMLSAQESGKPVKKVVGTMWKPSARPSAPNLAGRTGC